MKSLTFILIILSISVTFAQEGLVKTYYQNDSLKSEINYERNVRNGDAKFYYENGRIKEEVFYVNGKVEGIVKEYNEKGFLKELYTIEDGKRQGPSSYYDSTGVWIADNDFDSGVRKAEKKQGKEITVPQVEVTSKDSDNKKEETANNNKVKSTEEKSVPPIVKEESYDDDPAYYSDAEVMPAPQGGMAELQKKLIYPTYAKDNGIEGTVEVRAFIDQNGDVKIAEVMKGIGYGCDDVARITILYTKFTPGLIRGKPVKTQIVIPLEFKMSNKE